MCTNETVVNSDGFTLKDRITLFIGATALVLSIGTRVNQRAINHQHAQPEISLDLNYAIASSAEEVIATYDKEHLLLEVINKGPVKATQLSLSGCFYSYDKKKHKIVIASQLVWNRNEHTTFSGELDPLQSFQQQLPVGKGWISVYVFTIECRRPADLEMYRFKKTFLVENDKVYEENEYSKQPLYNVIMKAKIEVDRSNASNLPYHFVTEKGGFLIPDPEIYDVNSSDGTIKPRPEKP